MAAKAITIKGVKIEAKTRTQAVASYQETIGRDLRELLDKTTRDDMQITVGPIVFKIG